MQDYSKKSQYILGIVGCGNMGEAMLRGILETSFLFPREITFFDSDTARSGFISQKYGIFFSADIDSLVKESRYIVIAVKPQNIPEVLIELGKSFDPGYNKVISIAAGVSEASGWMETSIGVNVSGQNA